MDAFDVLHSGELYDPNAEELQRAQQAYLDRLYDFNATRPTELARRMEMLRVMFAEFGEGC